MQQSEWSSKCSFSDLVGTVNRYKIYSSPVFEVADPGNRIDCFVVASFHGPGFYPGLINLIAEEDNRGEGGEELVWKSRLS